MDNFIYFSEQVSESVVIKTENVDFEEVNLEENNEFISKNLYEKDPLNLGENSLSNDIKIENINQENICPICDQCFSSSSELSIHKESHFKTDINKQCEYCNTVVRKENYRRHLQNTHKMKDNLIAKDTKKSEHVCDVCQKSFRSLRIFKEHVSASHLGKKMYTCKFCSVEFVNRSSIIKHMYIHTKEKTHICHICNKAFLYKSYLKDHLNSHTGKKKFECNICYKKFIHRNTLRVHKFIHDPNAVKVCEKCGQNYFRRKNSDVNNCKKCTEPYHCEVCNKDIMHRGSFLRHIKIHTGTKEYTCQICNQGFVQKVAYNLHMSKHKKNGEELDTIEKVNMIKSKMEAKKPNPKEVNREDGNKSDIFFCQICDQQFETEDEINNHMEIHSELFLIENYNYSNSKYSCSHCPKKFSKEEKLLEHISKHKKEDSIKKYQKNIEKYRQGKNVTMRFQCEICPFRFKERENLEKHMLSHLGKNNSIETSETEQLIQEIHIENPFKCDSCSRTFINKLSLDKHLETHKNLISKRPPNENSDNIIENLKFNTEASFNCTVENCRKKFINQLSYETHMEVHHGDRPPFKIRKVMNKNGFRKVKFLKVECPENLLDNDLDEKVGELSPKPPEKINSHKTRRKNKILGGTAYLKPSVLNDVPKQKIKPENSENQEGLSPNVSKVLNGFESLKSSFLNQSSSRSLSPSRNLDLDRNLVCGDSKRENVSSSPPVLVQNVSSNSPGLVQTVSPSPPVLVQNVSPNPPGLVQNVLGIQSGLKVKNFASKPPDPLVAQKLLRNVALSAPEINVVKLSSSSPVMVQTGLGIQKVSNSAPKVVQSALQLSSNPPLAQSVEKVSSSSPVLVQTGLGMQKVTPSAVSSKPLVQKGSQFLVCRTTDNKIILLSTNAPNIARKNQSESLGTQKAENPILSTKITQVQNSNQKSTKEPSNTSVATSLHEELWIKNEFLNETVELTSESQNLSAKVKKSTNLASKGQIPNLPQKELKSLNLNKMSTKVVQPGTNLPAVQILPTIATTNLPNNKILKILPSSPILPQSSMLNSSILTKIPTNKNLAPKIVHIGSPNLILSKSLLSTVETSQKPTSNVLTTPTVTKIAAKSVNADETKLAKNIRIVRKRIGSNIEQDELINDLVEISESESVQNKSQSEKAGNNEEFDIVKFAKTLNASDFITRRQSRFKK